jgi:hypothetical protein
VQGTEIGCCVSISVGFHSVSTIGDDTTACMASLNC